MRSHPETEAAFRAALTGQGVPPGVTAVGDLERRFSVYRNTVAHSLTEALAQRFPAVRQITGPAFFDATAGLFARNHPPRTPLIHAYGADFPDFLATFPPAAGLPYLPDVARIEVLRGRAYHAADAAALPPEALAHALGADPDVARLVLHPALHVFTSPHPAVTIWQMNQPGATPQPPQPRAESALIFRRGDDAVVLPVPAAIAATTARLAAGTPLGALSPDTLPDQITATLSLLLRHGLVAGVHANQN